jgi:Domain of unknown function (DUF5666)
MTSNETDPAVAPRQATASDPATQPPATTPATTPGAAFNGTTGAPNKRRIGLVLGAGAVLAIVAAATSMAADSPNRDAVRGGANLALGGNDPALGDAGELAQGRFGRHGFGEITITAISGNAVTLGTPDGWSRTITITDTVDLTKGGQDIAVSDLKVGDQIRFSQTRNADGSYTVTAVAVVVPTIQGTASAITSTGFKVTTRDGSVWTVTVNGSTTYAYGQGTGTLADVKDGQAVRVQGTTTADNQITALNVRVAGDRAIGTVMAKTADTITIKRRDGSSLTIHVDADTTYRVAGVDNADLGDITVDMGIGVSGRARADGSIDADAVAAGKGLRGDRGGGRGEGGLDGPGLVVPNPADPIIEGDVEVPTA